MVIDELTDAIERFLRRVMPAELGVTEEPERVLVTALAIRTWSGGVREQAEAVVTRAGGRLQRPGLTATFDAPSRAIGCAREVLDALGADAGAGVHTAECSREDGGFRGPAIEVAAALAERAAPGELLISDAVKALRGAPAW